MSILTPTLNSARTLPMLFESLKAQQFSSDLVEVVVADGGSSDATRDIARAHGARIVDNPRKTGEAGKAVALRHARGEFAAFIDSDNILVGNDWLSRMLAPFEDQSIVASEPIAFEAAPDDSLVDRYCALAGVNDPFCLFMGNYDKMSAFTGRWTDLQIEVDDRGAYLAFSLGQLLPTIGANGTIYRRSVLGEMHGEYFNDIDVPVLLGRSDPHRRFAKVRTSIRHLYCRDLEQFSAKQTRRVRDYFAKPSSESARVYPWGRFLRRGLVRFVLSSITIVPLLFQSIRAYKRTGDRAAFLHPIVCWITACVYGVNVLFSRGRPLSRNKWQLR